MKNSLILFSFIASISITALAEQTVNEAATATKNDVKRVGKKTMNRLNEATCTEGDVRCAADKAKHRVEETSNKVSDKVKESADKVDHDDKSNH